MNMLLNVHRSHEDYYGRDFFPFFFFFFFFFFFQANRQTIKKTSHEAYYGRDFFFSFVSFFQATNRQIIETKLSEHVA